MNDTGSTIQTLYQHDWNAMNLGHNLPTQVTHITTANGQVTQTQSVTAQIRIVAATGNATNPWKILMNWTGENFVIRPWTATTDLLSGLMPRMHLYFATSPGNQNLYISQKKNGVVSQLPVV
ncbi:hypothetical protein B0T26DRAFT_725523 [Lasiosphaeria miniovina]|uniref:Uncharacterized protein n=1 Tax=Lasiosphaeria miniovina TaxID=1954250 RepID=A0AA39ZYV9_9PEZI|nr:uncharacterized protein B0T26DRAFT_725523 [Lasiosphaeria miniovina]KAK0706125.1 hypothetical protein B0T26DRAFT_725523 [Lasiosphaeria miniovina]